MSKEYLNGREVVSEGMENVILRPISGGLNIVLKICRPFNYLSMIGKDQAGVLRKELGEAHTLLKNSQVRIPRTIIQEGNEKRIFGLKTKGYVIGQRFIEEDGSITEVGDYLSQQGLTTLVDEYKHEPRNFVSNNGVLYWVDPTKGTVGRILEDAKIMKLETYRNLRQRFSKIIRFFGL